MAVADVHAPRHPGLRSPAADGHRLRQGQGLAPSGGTGPPRRHGQRGCRRADLGPRARLGEVSGRRGARRGPGAGARGGPGRHRVGGLPRRSRPTRTRSSAGPTSRTSTRPRVSAATGSRSARASLRRWRASSTARSRRSTSPATGTNDSRRAARNLSRSRCDERRHDASRGGQGAWLDVARHRHVRPSHHGRLPRPHVRRPAVRPLGHARRAWGLRSAGPGGRLQPQADPQGGRIRDGPHRPAVRLPPPRRGPCRIPPAARRAVHATLPGERRGRRHGVGAPGHAHRDRRGSGGALPRPGDAPQ